MVSLIADRRLLNPLAAVEPDAGTEEYQFMERSPANRLLLVDDEPSICASLKRVLQAEGYEVHVAHGADEALSILSRHPVDVIVSDQRMPGRKGTEFLGEARELYPDTVRIILSGAADMADVASAMDSGTIYKFLTKPIDPILLKADVREAFSRIAGKRTEDNRHATERDPVTGLLTRYALERLFPSITEEARSGHRTVCIVMLKVDQHQQVAGSFGYAFAQQFLRAVAHRLSRVFGAEHYLAHDTLDRFLLLATVNEPFQHFALLDDRLDDAFARPLQVSDQTITVTTSAGATAAAQTPRFDELVDQAHAAMVADSDGAGARVQLFQPQLVDRFRDRLRLETDLREAVVQECFQLHYQPQVDVSSGRIVGLEALVRWPQPDGRFVSPAHFIPAAERLGLIEKLGAWVLDAALAQLVVWRKSGAAPDELAVNVSPLQMSDISFVHEVEAALARHELSPHSLVLEVTESVAIGQRELIAECLEGLRELGVGLAIDDFGTGYANLSTLARLVFKKLKIDRSLLPKPGDSRSMSLFANIVAMGKELGLEVIAEGVEKPTELAAVYGAGCSLVQGYFYSAPLHPEQLTALLSGRAAGGTGWTHA